MGREQGEDGGARWARHQPHDGDGAGLRVGIAPMGLGIMRRKPLEAAIYAHHRTAFRAPPRRLPAGAKTLVEMAVEVEAGCAIAFEMGEAGTRRDGVQRLYRNPCTAGKAAVRAPRPRPCLAGGGDSRRQWYIEDWPVARQLRDAAVPHDLEGTENIICLDVLRSMTKEHADEALFARVERARQRGASRADERTASGGRQGGR